MRATIWIWGGVSMAAAAVVAGWLALRLNPAAPVASAPPPAAAPTPSAPAPGAPDPAPARAGFDVVRVAPDGAALVAGRAEPGAAVALRVDEVLAAEVMADAVGQFVALFDLAPSAVPQVLTLAQTLPDGQVIAAPDVVVLAPRPPAAAAPEPVDVAEAAPGSAPETGASPDPAPETSAEAVPEPAAETRGEGVSAAAPEAMTESVAMPGPLAEAGPAPEAVAEADSAATTAESAAPEGQTAAAQGSETAAAPLARDAPPGASGPPADSAQPLDVAAATTAPEAAALPGARAPQVGDAPVVRGEAPVQLAPAPGLDPAATVVSRGLSLPALPAAAPGGATPPVPPAAYDLPTVEAAATPRAPAPEVAPEIAAAQVQTAAPDLPPAFVVEDTGGVRLLDRAPQVLDNVVIDAITYAATGDVQVSGRARQPADGVPLRVYLDNRPLAVARSDGGDWRLDLPNVDPGVYTLRVDELAPDGRVISRFETPFQREDPGQVARLLTPAAPEPAPAQEPVAAPVAPAPRVALITVQPGQSLWRISREHYGAGERYVQIYRANRAQIRDPDLIYPGQIFALPD